MLQSLGINTLTSFLRNKEKRKASAIDDLAPLYEPRDDELSALEMSDKDNDNETMLGDNVPTKTNLSMTTRVSKRVTTSDLPARMTRQRTREASPVDDGCDMTTINGQEGSTKDAFVLARCAAQPEGHNQIGNGGSMDDQGKKHVRMGRDLDRISRGLHAKIPVIV